MATRFYLPSTGTPGISPAFGAGWLTGDADRREMVRTKISSAFTGKVFQDNIPSGLLLARQYVSSEALPAQTISGSCKGVVRGSAVVADRYRPVVRVAKCNSAGSSVVQILTYSVSTRSTTPPMLSSVTDTNSRFEQGSSDFVLELTSTPVDAGDRLIVEIGVEDTIGDTLDNVSFEFGDNSGSDLAENETGTSQFSPWIEFSGDLFQSAVALHDSGWYPIGPKEGKKTVSSW